MADQTDTRESRRREAARARRAALSAIMLLLLLLLILLLIAAATERSDILRFAESTLPISAPVAVSLGLQPRFGVARADTLSVVAPAAYPVVTPVTDVAIVLPLAEEPQATVAPTNSAADTALLAAIEPRLLDFYLQRGGVAIFGRPLAPAAPAGERVVQWFEYARLEIVPGPDGSAQIEIAPLGREYTARIEFPTQMPFADQPDARYFPNTGHGLVGPFLSFWNTIDGAVVLGEPISDQVQEILGDGTIHTVQYFERGRIEHHPVRAGTTTEYQIGALGRLLFTRQAGPELLQPARPTPVP
ncbi:MAG TPA: hypothetical protein PKA05_09785 [Roseiflexaceae bacterium]|nr:hypothetical protein [Roseiflexaceae bacterium]HMP40657.1 hypothetical protein [Roseiflexaceae bacterium]